MKTEELAKMIDHTNLKAVATEADIRQLCSEAKEYGFASVCVNSGYVPLAVKVLSGTDVKVCTVVGFPLGASSTEAKVTEAVTAVVSGAEEIDMVINLGSLKSDGQDQVGTDIQKVVKAVKEANHLALVKVIIENCYLSQKEKVTACQLAVEAGAQFVKTSTGFGSAGATCEDVKLMRRTVGHKVGVKAAGGIKTLSEAMQMINAGANRIGASAGVQIIKDLRCANN